MADQSTIRREVEIGLKTSGGEFIRQSQAQLNDYNIALSRLRLEQDSWNKAMQSGVVDLARYRQEMARIKAEKDSFDRVYEHEIALLREIEAYLKRVASARAAEAQSRAAAARAAGPAGDLGRVATIVEGLDTSTGSAATRVDVLGRSMGRARDNSTFMALAVLEASRAFEDAVVTGGNLAGVLNNIPQLALYAGMAFGQSSANVAKFTTAISLAATVAFGLYQSWDFFQDKLGLGIPPKALDDLDGLKIRLEKVNKEIDYYAKQKRISEADQAAYEALQATQKDFEKRVENARDRENVLKRLDKTIPEMEKARVEAFQQIIDHLGGRKVENELADALYQETGVTLARAHKDARDLIARLMTGETGVYDQIVKVVEQASGRGFAQRLKTNLKLFTPMTEGMKRFDEDMKEARDRAERDATELAEEVGRQEDETWDELLRKRREVFEKVASDELLKRLRDGGDADEIYDEILRRLKARSPGAPDVKLKQIARQITENLAQAAEAMVAGWRQVDHLTDREIANRKAVADRQRRDQVLAGRADENFTMLARAINQRERATNPFARRKDDAELADEGKLIRDQFAGTGMSEEQQLHMAMMLTGRNAKGDKIGNRGVRAFGMFGNAMDMGFNADQAVEVMAQAVEKGVGGGPDGMRGVAQFTQNLQGRMMRMQAGMLNQQARMKEENRRMMAEFERMEAFFRNISNQPSGQMRGNPR